MTEQIKDPYYAVIFTSVHTDNTKDYEDMADQMIELARKSKGFMGIDSARQKQGITISYWESIKDITDWKNNSQHILAQKLGKDKWYKHYSVKIAKILKEYEFNKS